MECIVAKNFWQRKPRRKQRRAADEDHGDDVSSRPSLRRLTSTSYLAPAFLEGKGEMLAECVFSTALVKAATAPQFFEGGRLEKALQAAGIRKPNRSIPALGWAWEGAVAYGKMAGLSQRSAARFASDVFRMMPRHLNVSAEFAVDRLGHAAASRSAAQ
jgi:hypothetical protein